MTRYFLKRVLIFVVLVALVFAFSYFMHNENAENPLSEMARTRINQVSIIPLTLLLLVIDSYLLKKRGLNTQYRVSLILSFIVMLFALFVVRRFIFGII